MRMSLSLFEKKILTSIQSEHFKVVAETSAPTFSTKTQFVKPLPTNPNTNSIPIRFVLTLDPPMPVADEVSQKLLNVTGLVDTSTLPTANAATAKSSNFAHTQSLEDMLVMSVKEDALHSDHSWVYVCDERFYWQKYFSLIFQSISLLMIYQTKFING